MGGSRLLHTICLTEGHTDMTLLSWALSYTMIIIIVMFYRLSASNPIILFSKMRTHLCKISANNLEVFKFLYNKAIIF